MCLQQQPPRNMFFKGWMYYHAYTADVLEPFFKKNREAISLPTRKAFVFSHLAFVELVARRGVRHVPGNEEELGPQPIHDTD